MIERASSGSAAQRPWCGGRPWAPSGSAPGVLPHDGRASEPRTELRGTGAELAQSLAEAALNLDGPELTTVGERARGHLVDLAVAAERVAAWAASVQACAVAAIHAQFMAEHDLDDEDLRERPEIASPVRRSVRSRPLADELAAFQESGRATAACLSLALGLSARAADRLVALALGLAEQPDLADALADGRVDLSQARVIHEATAALPSTARARIVASIVTDPDDRPDQDQGPRPLVRELRDGTTPVWSVPAHKLRPILAREVAAIAPESVEDREVVVAQSRRIEYFCGTPERSGSLVLYGPEPDLAAVYGRLDADARVARRSGAPETLDQLRYDLAIAAISGGALGLTLVAADPPTGPSSDQGSRPRITIDVVVCADTLLGVGDQPAMLRTPGGDAPISAAAARQLAHDTDATWRRILTDPATGTATDVSPGYAPAKRIAEFVRVRDGHTSRCPTSGARTLELDHVVEYDHAAPGRGGATSPDNLAASGKRDHQDKTDRLVAVSGDANGVLTYRTGAGHSYPSWPHRYTDPSSGPPPY